MQRRLHVRTWPIANFVYGGLAILRFVCMGVCTLCALFGGRFVFVGQEGDTQWRRMCVILWVCMCVGMAVLDFNIVIVMNFRFSNLVYVCMNMQCISIVVV